MRQGIPLTELERWERSKEYKEMQKRIKQLESAINLHLENGERILADVLEEEKNKLLILSHPLL